MKKNLLFVALLFVASLSQAQSYLNQVIVLNDGFYKYSTLS
jgi:hypothetical protein